MCALLCSWWRGSYNGNEGLFPANYIVEIALGTKQQQQAGARDNIMRCDAMRRAHVLSSMHVSVPCVDGTVHPSASNTQLDIHVRVVTPAIANTEVELQIAEGDIIHVSNKVHNNK